MRVDYQVVDRANEDDEKPGRGSLQKRDSEPRTQDNGVPDRTAAVLPTGVPSTETPEGPPFSLYFIVLQVRRELKGNI